MRARFSSLPPVARSLPPPPPCDPITPPPPGRIDPPRPGRVFEIAALTPSARSERGVAVIKQRDAGCSYGEEMDAFGRGVN